MAVSFQLRREWYDEIIDGSKRIEYRACTPFWETRLSGAAPGDEAVFLCGQDVTRGTIRSIDRIERPPDIPESAVKTDSCFAVHFTLSSQP
jgi:hypothetical protein